MNISVFIRLSVMMLLQYMIWGAWGSYLPVYLDELGFSSMQGGAIYSMLFFASMIAPFIGGQIADRYMASEKYLALSQLAGGVLMFVMAAQTQFWPFLLVMFLWSMFYAPTLPLTNVICFSHLSDVDRQFGAIRLWGTIGWILAGWFLTLWLRMDADGANCLRLAGVASIAMGAFSFFLPHTPPKKAVGNPMAFVDAFALLKKPSFMVFMIVAFVVATELQFYYILTGPFLLALGVESANISAWMTLAQIAEMLTLLILLPIVLPRAGIKMSILIGILAWPVRYIIFAFGGPLWLILASLPLHGLCYVFFFVVAQIYVDRVAPKDIRNSAQSLLFFVTFGLGLTLGSYFAGWIRALFTADGVTNWTFVFIIPVVLTILCAIAFVMYFKDPKENDAQNSEAVEPSETAS